MWEETKARLKTELGESRQKLVNALSGMGKDDWYVTVQPDGEKWNVLQMIRHLEDAERGLLGQAQRLAKGEITVPEDFDTDRWNARAQRKAAEAEMTSETALASIEQTRAQLVEFIDSIPDEAWSNMGWSSFYKRQLTLEEFLQLIIDHEAMHAEEIDAALHT